MSNIYEIYLWFAIEMCYLYENKSNNNITFLIVTFPMQANGWGGGGG